MSRMRNHRGQRTYVAVTWCLLIVVAACPAVAAEPLAPERMANVDQLINQAIARAEIPGAVLLVGRGDNIVYEKAYGNRSVRPTTRPMTVDTVFDLASLSKSVGCAPSVMLLAERGKLILTDPVAKHIPAFAANGKEAITIAQLLLHQGGLIADNAMADYQDGPAAALMKICALKPSKEPGKSFVYSDVGYIVLGELVRAVDGRGLDRFAREEIFVPAGMTETLYCPGPELAARSAPTQMRQGHWMQGEVHDPRAYALGGAAGHAGVFSTARDLSRFCRMILAGGVIDGKRVLAEATVREMTRARSLPDGTAWRTYGFDVDTGYSSCRGERFEARKTFGHTGFTGTMFWLDPEHDCYFILLTNSVHPDGKGKTIQLRKAVATDVGEALLGAK